MALSVLIVTQAVIAMKAFCKDKKRVKEVNERADFKLATKGKNGPPQFRKRSLEDVKPGDLLSFEPKPGEKVNLLLSHDYISQVYVPADVVLVAVACTCHRHLRCFQLLSQALVNFLSDILLLLTFSLISAASFACRGGDDCCSAARWQRFIIEAFKCFNLDKLSTHPIHTKHLLLQVQVLGTGEQPF